MVINDENVDTSYGTTSYETDGAGDNVVGKNAFRTIEDISNGDKSR